MDLLKLTLLLFICRGINSLDAESIEKCFKYVSGKYFNDQMILLLVPREEKGNEPDWLHGVVRHVIGSGKWSVCLSSDYYKPWNFYKPRIEWDRQRARNIVVLLREEDADASNKITKLTENWLWYSSARIMIIFKSEGTGEVILRDLWKTNRALNTVVMAIGRESIRFFTIEPFPNSDDVIALNEWKNGFQEEKDMFVDKIPADFKGHLLKIGLSYNEPYILKPKVAGSYEDGIELRIVKALRDSLNFGLEFVESPNGENPYIATVNGTPSGLFGLIHRRTADLMILGLKNRIDRQALSDALTPHIYDRSVWIVPESISERGAFHRVFEVEVWIAAAVTFCLLTCMFILLSRFNDGTGTSPVPRVSECIMLMFCSQLNYPTSLKTRRARVRVFMVVIYLYALHITSAYDSNLFQMFTSRTVKTFFDTPDEAAEAGLIAYLFPSGRPVYNQSNHKMWNRILSPTGHVYSSDYARIISIISRNKTAFSLLLENVARYEIAKRRNPNEKMVHIIDKPFSSYPVSIFMSRGHPLAQLLDRKVQQLVEGGLVNLWLKQFFLDYRQMRRTGSHFDGEQALKLKQFRLVFLYVMVGGWAASFLAFFAEVLVREANRRKSRKLRNEVALERVGW